MFNGWDNVSFLTLKEAETMDLTDIEAEALYSIAFSFYNRERSLPVNDEVNEEKIIENFKLHNPRSPCGPSFIS